MVIEITNNKILIEGESVGKALLNLINDDIEIKYDLSQKDINRLIEENYSLRNELNKSLIRESEKIREDINISTRTFPNKSTEEDCKYKIYKEYLHGLGWSNKLVILDQNDTDNICKSIKIKEPTSTYLIKIIFPEGTKITVDPGYIFGLIILDKDGREIIDDTEIKIIKDMPSDETKTLLSIYYSDIKMNNKKSGYVFDKGFVINARWNFIITTYRKLDIPKENIMFRLMFDYWTKE